MNKKATYLFICCFLFLAGNSWKSFAQPYLGVVWEVPADSAESLQHLNAFSALGVTHLEVSYPIHPQVLEQLRRFDFRVFVRSHYTYLTTSELRNDRVAMIDKYSEILNTFRSYPSINNLGLFTNSQTHAPEFKNTIQPVLDTLSKEYTSHFYYYSGKDWYQFNGEKRLIGSFFDQKNYQTGDIVAFDQQFQNLISTQKDQILFMPSDWFMKAISEYNPLTESLAIYQETGIWNIPLPETSQTQPSANWLVLLLLFLWVFLGFQIKYLPYIRPMMIRYYLSHRFFVDDILHYRERAATGGILLMISHSIFGGIVCYISANLLMTEAGIQALFHHLPFLALTGVNYTSFFFLGIILTLMTQLIAIFWIYLPAKNLEHISQGINLYAGAFYSDYLLVTLMITLYVSSTGSNFILILAGLYVLIWYGAFNLAALNASRGLGQRKVFYLIITIGLHTLISLFIFIALFHNEAFIQILKLAFSLT